MKPAIGPKLIRWERNISHSLLKGAPTTHGIKSGHVVLYPGQKMHSHSTLKREEVLVVIRGCGTVAMKGHPHAQIEAGTSLYIPPETHHDVTNNSDSTLEYVYVVAPLSVKL